MNLAKVEVVRYPDGADVFVGGVQIDGVTLVNAVAEPENFYKVTLSIVADDVRYREATKEEVMARRDVSK